MVVNCFSFVSVLAEDDYEKRYDYYMDYCLAASEDDEKAMEICSGFNDYLKAENDKLTEDINELQSKSDDIQTKVNKYSPELEHYDELLEKLDKRIDESTEDLDEVSNPYQELTQRILKLSEDIKKLNEKLEDRVEWILCGSDRAELLDVFEEKDGIVAAVRDYLKTTPEVELESEMAEKKLDSINSLTAQRDELEGSLNEANNIRNSLYEQKTNIQNLKREIQKTIVEYKKTQSEIEADKVAYVNNREELISNIENISEKVIGAVSSDEFIPVLSSFNISASAWHYPESFGGGIHLGMDFAAPKGTDIIAPANGIVLFSSNACAVDGNIGNMCGEGVSGGGNQIAMLVVVKNELYVVSVYHMSYNTVIKSGTEIKQGDYIGQVGTTGNSTGPHAHVEVIKLNEYSDFDDFMSNWDGDLSFGTGYGSTGYSNRCDVVGNNKNCRLNPENVFGLTYGSAR